MNKWMKAVLPDFCTMLNTQSRVFSQKVYIIVETIKMIQLFSTLIPPEPSGSPPWNYSDMKFLWKILASFTRLNYLIGLLRLPAALVFIVISAYSLLISLELWILFRVVCQTRNKIYLQDTDGQIKPIILKVENLLRYLFTDVMFIPTIFILLSLPETLETYHIGHIQARAIEAILSIIYISLIIVDSLFLQDLSWKSNAYNLIASPRYILNKKIYIIAICMFYYFVDYSSQPYIYAVFNVIVGILFLQKFFWIQPYAFIALNLAACIKGLAFLLSGIIFFILKAENESSQSSYTCTLIFFLTLPLLIYMCKIYIYKRRNYIVNGMDEVTKAEYIFQMIFHHTKSSFKLKEQGLGQDDARMRMLLDFLLKNFNKNSWGYLWGIHHFLSKKHWIGAHIFLSESLNSRNYTESYVYFKQARIYLLNYLKEENGHEWEGFNFVNFRESLDGVLKEDKICCNMWLKVFQKMLATYRTSSGISSDIRTALTILNYIKELCIYQLKNYESNSEILEYYAGFLENLMNSPSAKDVKVKAIRKKEEELKLTYNKDETVSFFNRNNMKLCISLESQNSGMFEWVYNPLMLGYTIEELENENIGFISPSPIKEIMIEFTHSSKYLWKSPLNLESAASLYLKHRNGYLVPVLMASRIASTNNNSLILISSVMLNKFGNEAALLDDDGRFITGMVKYT
jgi:hypothetical protein